MLGGVGSGTECERAAAVMGATVLSAFAMAAVWGQPAWAGEPAAPIPEPEGGVLSVEAQLGLGAPLGLAGAAAELGGRSFGVGAGIGAGVSGMQWAATARYRLWVLDRLNLNIGAGLSGGPYEWVEPFIFDDPARKHWDLALWANGEVSVEVGSRVGLHVRGFAGVGNILNRQDGVCVGDTAGHCSAAHSGDGYILPFVGVALAYGFPVQESHHH